MLSFFAGGPFSFFYLENSQTFFVKELGFRMALVEQLGDDSWYAQLAAMIVGMRSLLP